MFCGSSFLECKDKRCGSGEKEHRADEVYPFQGLQGYRICKARISRHAFPITAHSTLTKYTQRQADLMVIAPPKMGPALLCLEAKMPLDELT